VEQDILRNVLVFFKSMVTKTDTNVLQNIFFKLCSTEDEKVIQILG